MERVRKVLINVCLASPADSVRQSAARDRAHSLHYHLHCGLEYESSVMCPGHPAIAALPHPHSLEPLFVLGALATSDQRINPEMCILSVRGTLWSPRNTFKSGVMLKGSAQRHSAA